MRIVIPPSDPPIEEVIPLNDLRAGKRTRCSVATTFSFVLHTSPRIKWAGGNGTPAAMSNKMSPKKAGVGVSRRVSATPSVPSGWHTSICMAVVVVGANWTESV